jgi:hypothetical protein
VGRTTIAVLAACLLLAGCTSAVRPDRPEDAGGAPRSTFGFTQLIPLEGTEHALLRVANTGAEAFHATGVGLTWAGYPGTATSPAAPSRGPGSEGRQ